MKRCRRIDKGTAKIGMMISGKSAIGSFGMRVGSS